MNSDLKDRVFELPENVLKKINDAVSSLNGEYADGVERAVSLINNKKVTYGQLKRIIHDMKNMDKNSIKYELCGGKSMEIWSNQYLNGERNQIKNKKEMTRISTEIGGIERKNPYLKTHKKKNYSVFDPKSITKKNSDKNSATSIISSLKLFEEIKKIKNLIKY